MECLAVGQHCAGEAVFVHLALSDDGSVQHGMPGCRSAPCWQDGFGAFSLDIEGEGGQSQLLPSLPMLYIFLFLPLSLVMMQPNWWRTARRLGAMLWQDHHISPWNSNKQMKVEFKIK